jgi:uncharacterized membrane protein YeiH
VAAACLGVTTAVGGGVLRDVIAREVPAFVRADSQLYAVPAMAGALARPAGPRPLTAVTGTAGIGVGIRTAVAALSAPPRRSG